MAPRSERLTGWRQRGFAAGYALLGIACAGGLAVAWQTGSRRVVEATGEVVAEYAAAPPLVVAWLGFALLAVLVACCGRTRRASLAAALALLAGASGFGTAVFFACMDALGRGLGDAMADLLTLKSLFAPHARELHVELWPGRVVAAAVLACLAAGVLAPLAHLVLFWREDVVRRDSPRPVA